VDPMINQAANWSYMFAGRVSVPVVFRAVINRGGEQGAQHSQALQAMFMHVPGLKVVMPSTAHDAKGLLIAAVQDDTPVLYIDDRWLYEAQDDVPEAMYATPIGEAAVRRRGRDVTIVATSYMAAEAHKAVAVLEQQGIEPELIDLRSIKPWDRDAVFASVARTGRLIVADGGWQTAGVAAEVIAAVACEIFDALRAPAVRVCLPDAPAPVSRAVERAYYVGADELVAAAVKMIAR
jgi:acetoin:2,6-dichlorophenolindophenol oxidoreductase subunit beta